MDAFEKIEHFFTSVMPVLTPTIIAWISYRLPKKAKEETDKIVSELTDVKKQIEDVQTTAKDSNSKIDEVQEKLKGGNGYIDRLFSDFEKLDIKEGILIDD